MRQLVLSIIIPIYNVEQYVERCLRSLENQDIPENDYEIICINDGSPDNSRGVVTLLQKEFNNIILIDQENQGVSRARNNGINKARGRYIMFVDPDDYVESKSMNPMLKNAEEMDAQVSFLGFTFLDEKGIIRNKVLYGNYASRIYAGIDAYFLARGDGQTDPDRMVAVLFKTDFLNNNNLRYLPDVPYLEDGEFIARILCIAERCIFEGNSFYLRTTRLGSVTNSKLFHSEKATNGFLLATCNLKRFQQEQTLNVAQKHFLNQPIAKFVILAVNSSASYRTHKKFKCTIESLRSFNLNKINIQGCKNPFYLYGKVYNFSPYLLVATLFLYPRVLRLYKILFRS